MVYQIVNLCKYGDFSMLSTVKMMLVPAEVDINDHIESFWFEHKNDINQEYSSNDTYIPLKSGIVGDELIEKFIEQMKLYGAIFPKTTSIKFGN